MRRSYLPRRTKPHCDESKTDRRTHICTPPQFSVRSSRLGALMARISPSLLRSQGSHFHLNPAFWRLAGPGSDGLGLALRLLLLWTRQRRLCRLCFCRIFRREPSTRLQDSHTCSHRVPSWTLRSQEPRFHRCPWSWTVSSTQWVLWPLASKSSFWIGQL